MQQQQQLFTELYRNYGPGIYKLCLGYTGDSELARDLLQETFLAVWKHMGQFRAEAHWRSWIYRIAVNTCLGFLRKKSRVDPHTDHIPLLADEVSEQEQEIDRLYLCISRLAAADRLLIGLLLEDTPYPEMAAITGITENNLRVRIHRIKKQLTDLYNRYERL